MRYTSMITLSLVSALLAALSPAGAQEGCPEIDAVVVETIVNGLETLETTPEVFVMRLGSFDREPLGRCMELEVGDEIRSPRGQVIVELRCPAGSTLTLSEQFRATIAPPGDDQDCKVALGAGVLGSDSGSPTGVDAGPVAAGALRTRYEVRVDRESGEPSQSVQVYEGKVAVTAVDDAETTHRVLEPGRKVLHRLGDWSFDRIQVQDIAQTTRVYARLAVGKAAIDPSQKVAALHQFSEVYNRALFRPDDAYAQLELAEVQLRYQMPTAALRQLSRARQAPTDPEIVRRMDALETTAREIQSLERYQVDSSDQLQIDREQIEQLQENSEPPS